MLRTCTLPILSLSQSAQSVPISPRIHSAGLMQEVCCHAGLMLVLLYGREGLFAPILRAAGFRVVFAFPGEACQQVPYPHFLFHKD